jgi:hypothetical protein
MSMPRFGRPPSRNRRRRLHRMGWYRNDMRRRSDRWEIGWVAVLLLAFLAGLPFIAYAAARDAYRDDVRQQSWNRAHRMHTEAVLLADAPPPAAGSMTDSTVALARWTAPDGTTRLGTVQVVAGRRAGTSVGIWTDEHGAATTEPAGVHPRTDAANVAVVVMLGGGAALVLLRVLLRVLLHRRRLQSWQQEWLEVGPRWSRHR